MPETLKSRPMPQRPSTGLLAWESTIGYIRNQYHLDVTLTLQATPEAGSISWQAIAVWGQNSEQVGDKLTLADALRDLWRQIDRKHIIFESREALIRRPTNYADHEWLDDDTRIMLNQTLDVILVACAPVWTLTFIYQPVEMPDLRFQAGLTAHNAVQLLERGPTLQAACRELYRRLAQNFIQRSTHEMPKVVPPETVTDNDHIN